MLHKLSIFSGKTTDTAKLTVLTKRAVFANTDGTTATNLKEGISLAEYHLKPVLAPTSADQPQKSSHST